MGGGCLPFFTIFSPFLSIPHLRLSHHLRHGHKHGPVSQQLPVNALSQHPAQPEWGRLRYCSIDQTSHILQVEVPGWRWTPSVMWEKNDGETPGTRAAGRWDAQRCRRRLNCVPKSSCWSPNPRRTVFWRRAFRERFRLREVIRGVLTQQDWSPCKKRKGLGTRSPRMTREDAGDAVSNPGREASGEPTRQHLHLGPPSPQTKRTCRLFKAQTCGTLQWHPGQAADTGTGVGAACGAGGVWSIYH